MPPRVEQVRLAEVQSRGTSALPDGRAIALPADNSTGEALQLASNKLEATATNLQKIVERTATENNEAAAKEADTQFNSKIRDTLFDPQKGYFTLKGKAAFEGYKPTEEALRTAQRDHAATLTNPEVRRMFNDIATRRLDGAFDSMAKHSAIERRGWLDGVSAARALNQADDAIVWASDPAKRDAAINVGRNEIVTNGRDLGEDPEVTNRKLREYDTKTYKGIIEKLVTEDPIGAAKVYEDNKHRIDGSQQPGIERVLKEAGSRRRADSDVNEVMASVPTGSYGEKVGKVENGGKYGGTPNASTNAGGKYQFTDGTWLDNVRKADPEATKDKSDAELLKLKTSDTPEGRALQDKTFNFHTRENEKALSAAGLPINDTTRRMAHWFGAKGAAEILKADPSTPIERFFKEGKGADGKVRSPEEWAAENGVKGQTVGQVVALVRKQMGDRATDLPGEGPVRTFTDPREKAREIEANFDAYATRMKEAYGNDAERYDKAMAVLKQRKAVLEEGFAAQQKVDGEKALQIALTPGAGGMKPTTIDAIPPDLWTRLSAEQQRSIIATLDHNLRQSDRKPNPGLYAELSRQAVEDPEGFKKRDLVPLHGELPEAHWRHFQDLQTVMGARGNSQEEKHATLQKGLQISDALMKSAAIYMGFADSKGKVTKAKEFNEFKAQYETALLQEMEAYRVENKKKPNDDEIKKMADRLLMQGRVKGTGWFSDDKTVLFRRRDEAGGEGFYVPYDQIPKADRAAIERQMEARKLLTTNMSKKERQKAVEDFWEIHARGAGK